MRLMTFRATVYVPDSRLTKVHTQVAALAAACGGSSTIALQGVYIDNTGKHHVEDVHKMEVWYNGQQQSSHVESAVKDLVAALIAAGEECVMVEWLTPHGLTVELWSIDDVEG